MDVLRSTNNAKTLTKPGFGNRYETGDCSFNPSKTKPQGNRDVQQLSHLNHVLANAHSSQGESQSYIFEDNEPVIKMIIKVEVQQ